MKHSSESDSLGDPDFVTRWTASCINQSCPLFTRKALLNSVYCIVPTALAFATVTTASRGHCTKQLAKLWKFSDEDLRELREKCEILVTKQSPVSLHCFVRFLVDEEHTTTVSTELMDMANRLAGQQVFSSIKPSKAVRFVSQLCVTGCKPLDVAKPQLLTCNAYASAAINARFCGKTCKVPEQRFLCTYSSRIQQPFFQLKTKFRQASFGEFEAIQVPLRTDESKQVTITFLRPHLIGQLLFKNLGLTAEDLQTMFDRLDTSKQCDGTILLPEAYVSSKRDLWSNIGLSGINGDLGRSSDMPVLASIWHWSTISISSTGVQHHSRTEAPPKRKKEHCRINSALLEEKAVSYVFRLDSPFTFIVTVEGVHFLVGTYYGPQIPRTSEIAITAPEKIRFKRFKKPYTKKKILSRKQKLRMKMKKKREKDELKERKKKEKEERKSKSKGRRSKSYTRSTSLSRSESTSKSVTTSASTALSDSSTQSGSMPTRAWTKMKSIFRGFKK